MRSYKCPLCGKKFISEEYLKMHIETDHPEQAHELSSETRKGWRTPYGFIDFPEPVTYEHACGVMQSELGELEAMKAGK